MADNNTQEKKDTVKDVAMENIWAAGCYIPFLNIATCVLCSVKMVNSKSCRFHARQGFVFFGVMFLSIFVALISTSLSSLVFLAVIALHGVGIYFAYQKKDYKFPVLSQLAEKIPEYFVFTTLTGKNPEKEQDSAVAPVAVQPEQVVVQPQAPVEQAPVVQTPAPVVVEPTPAPAPVVPAEVPPVVVPPAVVPEQPKAPEQPAAPVPEQTPAQPEQKEEGSVQWSSRSNH